MKVRLAVVRRKGTVACTLEKEVLHVVGPALGSNSEMQANEIPAAKECRTSVMTAVVVGAFLNPLGCVEHNNQKVQKAHLRRRPLYSSFVIFVCQNQKKVGVRQKQLACLPEKEVFDPYYEV